MEKCKMNINFEWIYVKNFLSYSNEGTKFEFVGSGLNMITGPNGSGKSSIITDALCYNLYGEPYRKIKKDELLNDINRKGMITESCFVVGKDRYRIVRGRKPDIFEIYKNEEEMNMLSTKALTQGEVDKIIGIDHKMFRNVLALAVNYNKPFLELSKQEKRDIIELMFNINIFGDMLKSLKMKISKLKTDIEIDKNSVDLLSENIRVDEKRIQEIEESRVRFEVDKKENIERLTKKIDKLNSDIEACEKFINDSEKEIEELDKKTGEDIKFLNKKIEELNCAINEKVKDVENECSEKEKQYIDKLELMKKNFESYVEKKNIEIEQKKLEIEKIKSDSEEEQHVLIDKIENVKLKGKHKIDELTEKKSKCVNHNIDEIEKRISNTKLEIDRKETKIDEINKKIQFFDNNDVCPECTQDISDAEKEKKILECKESIHMFEKEISTLRLKLNVEEDNKKTYHDNEEKYRDVLSNIDKVSRAVDDKVNEYESELFKLKNSNVLMAAQHDLSNIEGDLKSKIEIFELRMSEKDDKLKAIFDEKSYRIDMVMRSDDLIALQNKLKSVDMREKQGEIIAKVKATEDNKSYYVSSVKETYTDLEIIKSKAFDIDIDTIKKQHRDKVKEYTNVNDKYETNLQLMDEYKIVRELLGENGIKAFFFKKLIPIMNQKINYYLDKFELPVSVIFNEQLDVDIFKYSNRDKSVNYNGFSAGERKRIDISILLSFIDIAKLITNWSCNVQVWDEVLDSGVDGDGLVKLIKNMKDYVDKKKDMIIYVVSHKLQDVGYFDNIVEVEKRGNFSYIKG